MVSPTDALRYLPLEVAGQTFAIPISEVVTVQHVYLSNDTGEITTSESDGQAGSRVPVIDLRHLFWREGEARARAHVIVISTSAGTCAVLADAVRPTRTAEPHDRRSLPPLVAAMQLMFREVIRETEELVLVIDSQHLIEQLRQVRPELVAERIYVT